MKTITGKELNEKWDVGAKHALAYKDGDWYHYLERFPGALFDTNGYVLFDTNKDYINCKDLKFGVRVHVPGGISSILGYVKKENCE